MEPFIPATARYLKAPPEVGASDEVFIIKGMRGTTPGEGEGDVVAYAGVHLPAAALHDDLQQPGGAANVVLRQVCIAQRLLHQPVYLIDGRLSIRSMLHVLQSMQRWQGEKEKSAPQNMSMASKSLFENDVNNPDGKAEASGPHRSFHQGQDLHLKWKCTRVSEYCTCLRNEMPDISTVSWPCRDSRRAHHHLLQVVWAGPGQEVGRPPADEVVQRDQQVLKVVNGPLVEAGDQLRPQAPHLLRNLLMHPIPSAQGGALA